MDLSDKLIIKVQLNDEIRKMPIHNEEITYDELIIMMERVFKHKLNPNDEITIKYKDEDDDLITISDDSDLIFAISNTTSSKVLKLVLTVENEDIDPEKNEKQLGSLDLKTIRKELQHIRDYTNKLLDKIVHINVDPNVNVNTSGRTSTTGVGDYHGVGGKEFDPLSVGNQTNFQNVERTGSSASIGSNVRQEDISLKSNVDRSKQSPSQERHLESHEIQRPSPTLTKSQNMPMTSGAPISNMGQHMTPSHMQSSAISGAFNLPPSTIGGGQNFQSQSMAGSNTPHGGMHLPPSSTPIGISNLPQSSMSGHNLPPQNMSGQNLPPQGMAGQNFQPQNMSGQNLPPQGMAGQNFPPQNMPGQNLSQQNVSGQNLPPQNMSVHNLPPSNVIGQHSQHQNLPPSSMPGQHLPPSHMTGFNPVSQTDGAPKMPGYMPQTMQSPMNVPRPGFYPPQPMPGQPRPSIPNFNAPNGQQVRPNMGPSYFNPPTTMQQGGPMFNPQMQQPPQNSNFGYQPNK